MLIKMKTRIYATPAVKGLKRRKSVWCSGKIVFVNSKSSAWYSANIANNVEIRRTGDIFISCLFS